MAEEDAPRGQLCDVRQATESLRLAVRCVPEEAARECQEGRRGPQMGAWQPRTAAKVGGDDMSNALSDWQEMHRALGKAPDTETAESWHKVHAQLLKSVADAQARLLAAQNETNDRLERMDRDLRVLIGQTQETVRNSHHDLQAGVMALLGRLNEISDRTMALEHVGRALDALSDRVEAVLAKPRRQVEKLRPKRIVKRAVERKR